MTLSLKGCGEKRLPGYKNKTTVKKHDKKKKDIALHLCQGFLRGLKNKIILRY